MSDRQWSLYVADMIRSAERVLEYTRGMDQPTFVEDRLRYDATIRNLEILGEAAAQIPDSVRDAYPEIPWRQVVATRNVLIHGYSGIDDDVLWNIVQEDVPSLLEALRRLSKDEC